MRNISKSILGDHVEACSRISSFRGLFGAVQRAHYKSTIMPKLKAAIDVYVGLASIKSIRQEVLLKLAGILLHPFPQVSLYSRRLS